MTLTIFTATVVALAVVAYVVLNRRKLDVNREMVEPPETMAELVHVFATQMRSLILGVLFLVTVISIITIYLMIRLQLSSNRSTAIFDEFRHQEQQILCFADRNDDFSVALADLLIFSLGNPNPVQSPEEREAMDRAIERLKQFRDRVEEADNVLLCDLEALDDQPTRPDENAALTALFAGIVTGGAAVWVLIGRLRNVTG